MTTSNLFEAFLEKPGKKQMTKVGRETSIVRQGQAIIVPEHITYRAAADALMERAKQEEEPMQRMEKFTCHPNDGFIAITRLIKETFGFTQVRSEMFNSATTVRVRTGLGIGDYEEALCGGVIGIPSLPDVQIRCGGDVDEMEFFCHIIAKEKHAAAVNAFLNDLRRRIESESIYHGKAFDSKFNFLDLRGAHENKVVLPKITESQVRANLYTPLEHRERLATIGTPFGRSVLLEGPYGTGKTLLAFIAGKKATDHGITFLYVRSEDAEKLPLFLRYARQYAPAVLFYEDIDLLMGTDDDARDEGINLVLNTLDGIDAKSGAAQQVMLVMTTNDVNSINEALMRPGRIDAVIHVGLPDAPAAGQLVKQYGGSSLELGFDTAAAGAACDGMTPAFIREVVERSKLVALSRNPQAPTLAISAEDVVVAAQEIQDHLLLAAPRVKTHTAADRLAGAFKEVITGAVQPQLEVLDEALSQSRLSNGVGFVYTSPERPDAEVLPMADGSN